MNKKEIQEKLNNLPKPKYLYQRYDGRISKYLVDGDYILDIETGMNVKEKILLGKVSENIIDLIEVGDYVNGERVMCFKDRDNCDYDIGTQYSDDFGEYYGFNKEDIKYIVTKEQFESINYEV